MKMSKLLDKNARKGMYNLQDNLKPPKLFKDLPDGARFTVGRSRKTYRKVANSHSVDETTNMDAIFTLRTRIQLVRAPHAQS